MLTASDQYKAEIVKQDDVRRLYGKVDFRQVDVDAKSDCTPTASSTESISSPENAIDGIEGVNKNYASFETDRWKLDGSFSLLPNSSFASMGWWSSTLLCDATTRIFTPNITFTCTFTLDHSSVGITILWDVTNGEYAEEFDVVFYNSSDVVIETLTITGNTEALFINETAVNNYRKIIITVKKWSVGSRRARIEEILFGVLKIFSYSNEKLMSFNVQEELDTIASKYIPNKLDFNINNQDKAYDILNPSGIYQYLQTSQEINAYIGVLIDNTIEYVSVGKFYLESWETNQNSLEAKFTATDLLASMNLKTYYKGLKQSITLYDLAEDILTDYGLSANQYNLDSLLNGITVTNFLPICTYLEALQHVAICGQCVLYQSRDGKITIKRLVDTNIGIDIDKDNMLEPTPKITLDPVLKQVDVEVTTLTVAVATTDIAKSTVYINGTQNLWVLYDDPADSGSATVSSGTINSATYYTNGAYLNITATGDTTITITGNVITMSKSIQTTLGTATEGEVKTVKSQLIDSTALAIDIGTYIKAQLELRKKLSVKWRTNPIFELGDVTDIETQFNTYEGVRITSQSYEYMGSLKGNVEVKG